VITPFTQTMDRLSSSRRTLENISNSRACFMQQIDEYQMVGSSVPMARLRQEVAIAAKSDAKVLITGESGAGKELVARILHHTGWRRSKPLRAINCAAVSDDLLESELFGHVRGSFTGAVRDHQGIFEAARSGTVILDEIGESSARMQTLLLRFLQFGELQRVGEIGCVRHVDERVVATMHRNFRELIAQGEFRLDLFYRLNVIAIHVSPLRERADDIPTLLEHFTTRFSHLHRLPCRPSVATRWPGSRSTAGQAMCASCETLPNAS
jgi:transcriptional regulator with GAF, ATPase, and Fis domain